MKTLEDQILGHVTKFILVVLVRFLISSGDSGEYSRRTDAAMHVRSCSKFRTHYLPAGGPVSRVWSCSVPSQFSQIYYMLVTMVSCLSSVLDRES